MTGEHYWPCECRPYNEVLCDRIAMKTVRQIFQQKNGNNSSSSNKKLENLKLKIASDERHLPANLLADHRVTNRIDIECTEDFFFLDEDDFGEFRIDAEAFRATRNFTREIDIGSCDLKGFDFFFLEYFQNLECLSFYWVSNYHLAAWLTFLRFNSLKIIRSQLLSEWTEFPALVTGLSTISLKKNEIGDAVMDKILQWVIESSSIETLKYLDIEGNELITRIPKQISKFQNLESLHLDFNKMTSKTLFSRSLPYFSCSVEYLSLISMGIGKIEPGTFRGI